VVIGSIIIGVAILAFLIYNYIVWNLLYNVSAKYGLDVYKGIATVNRGCTH
jgi:hypothetical protein